MTTALAGDRRRGRVAVAALLLMGGWITADGDPAMGLDIQGHRGARGLLPENTLPAFRKAIELGVTTLELDLQVTRDRVLVVHHDPALDPRRCRMDDGGPLPRELIRDLDASALAGVDCGSLGTRGFPTQEKVPGARIPRLEEVLALARDAPYPVRLNIEIKMREPDKEIPADEFAVLAVDAVLASGLEGRITLQSFDPAVLRMVRERTPRPSLAILVVRRRDYERLVAESGADILSPRYQGLRHRDVESFRSRGVRVVPWTVNREKDIRRLIGWGVDGIISDYPDRVLAVLETAGGKPARHRATDGR